MCHLLNLQVLHISKPLQYRKRELSQENRGLYSSCRKLEKHKVTHFKTTKDFPRSLKNDLTFTMRSFLKRIKKI